MIAFVYGTTAELIKLAPIHERLVADGHRPLHWCTSQQASELPAAAAHLGMPEPDIVLANGVDGRSLRSTTDVVRWLGTFTSTVARRRREMRSMLRADGKEPFVLVHGDTMTTVLGALLGRLLGATVAHVEAGLRSHDIRHPFPEEIDRILAARIARVHYAPGETEVANLARVRGDVVVTGGNTVRDSLYLVPDEHEISVADVPETYGLVSLHRMELIRTDRFADTMHALQERSRDVPLVQIVDAVTDEQLESTGLARLHDGDRFLRVDKLEYFDFIALLRGAEFVVTDSGGLQEETAGLGIPCLVHREKTERSDGLGQNAVLSGMTVEGLLDFLDDPATYRRDPVAERVSPSDVIVDDLRARGAC